MEELGKLIEELKFILYGSSESEPIPEACAQVTQEFFQENTLRLLILCLPKLNLEVSIDSRLHHTVKYELCMLLSTCDQWLIS